MTRAMARIMAPILAALLCLLPLAGPAAARPVAYLLEPEGTTIAFEADFGKDRISGQIPPASADLTLDFDQVSNCRIAVTLDVSRARANLPFVAEAMKSATVLDAANHPQMLFKSTKVRATDGGAIVTGTVTIRGVTQPMTLRAQLFRPRGSVEGDRSRLTLKLSGSLSRSAFGATGWSDMVGDEVRILITARIAAKG